MKKEVTIPNIHCHHCEMTIKRELAEIDGVKNVEVDVDSKQVSVTWEDPATWQAILDTLSEIGYPPEP